MQKENLLKLKIYISSLILWYALLAASINAETTIPQVFGVANGNTCRTFSYEEKEKYNAWAARDRIYGFILDAAAYDKEIINNKFDLHIGICTGSLAALANHKYRRMVFDINVMYWDDLNLRALVYHELGHMQYNLGHDDSCPIMSATVDPDKFNLNEFEQNKIFIQMIRKETQ